MGALRALGPGPVCLESLLKGLPPGPCPLPSATSAPLHSARGGCQWLALALGEQLGHCCSGPLGQEPRPWGTETKDRPGLEGWVALEGG